MSTAIVGLGNIGSRLAKNLTTGGEKIIVAEKTLEKAEKLAKELAKPCRSQTRSRNPT
jgi:8-hydroxy-5-deazaflavin:NADPH oxidoreductase